ncbi:MAG TPA: Uma2 family endonuclease [Thermoanaerobaculia bacterium]|nr:Uma2 family endonuclease [Thermoanaerobaculia bacterium]
MKTSAPQFGSHGPFRADQLRSGDPYELSNGHPIHCLPTGRRGGKAVNVGGGVLASDPAVQDVGVDTGFSPSPDVLRAPDLSVGKIPDLPGWAEGAPPLAVEYADTGQDEADLRIKIQELFAAGTRYVWVVRLTGPRRVEVHQPGQGMRILNPEEQLEAPGILANPVPVKALYDRETANQVIFRNLLQREGYASLEEVRAEGEAQVLRESVVEVLTARGFTVAEDLRTALAGCGDPAALRSVHRRSVTATSVAEIIATLRG